MSTTMSRTAMRTSLTLALGLLLGSAGSAHAAAITYNTTGTVGASGVTGQAAIGFASILDNSFRSPSTLSLGTFVVSALSDGATTVYDHTPFSITFAVRTVDGIYVAARPPILTLSGFLNGVVSGASRSTVVAVFDPIPNDTIQLGPALFANLTLPSPERNLVPSTTSGGQSTVEGFVDLYQTVPEPTTVALFSVVIGGLGLRRIGAGRRAKGA